MFKYDGIGQVVITAVTADGNKGKVLSIMPGGMMLTGGEGDEFHGYCLNVRNGIGAVQVQGAVTLPYTGEAPEVGFCQLVCDGDGGVMVGSSAKQRLVLLVDESAQKITFMM